MPATRFVALFFVAALALVAIVISGSHRAAAGSPGCIISVNSTADDDTANTVVTLREAIGFATDLHEPAAGEKDEISHCEGDDDDPGADSTDLIMFDAAVFPSDANTKISLDGALPNLNKSNDTVSGGGVVTVDGQDGDYACFRTTSSDNNIAGLRILNCQVGVDIRAIVVLVGVAGSLVPSNNLVSSNVIVGNDVGVSISGGSFNTVSGNMIGLEADGSTPNANGTGVRITSGFSNIIGYGSLAIPVSVAPASGIGEANVISGNTGNGVEIDTSTNDQVKGNIIGLGLDGQTPAGNGRHGVSVFDSNGVHIGSPDSPDRNIISSNTRDGVNIAQQFVFAGSCCVEPAGVIIATGTVVQGNFIGTDQSGFLRRGNGESGVRIENATINTIGGTEEGEGNLISANEGAGVLLTGPASSVNLVRGNVIGADLDQLSPLPNDVGVQILDAPSNTVGGDEPADRNVIVGNTLGVGISEQGAEGNQIQGNLIGELPNGGEMGNTRGVSVQNSGPNLIGGTTAASGNVIAHNEQEGVVIVALPDVSSRKSILSNSVYDNGALGIDLEGDGVTLNDDEDPDTGANQHQNYPLLQSAEEDSGQTTIIGTLNSTPNTGFRVQLFANSECDQPSGSGEGKVYLGDVIVPATDTDGNATFDKTFDVALGGQYITATATDPEGNTSEFSACKFVSGATMLQIWGDIDCMNGLTAVDSLGTLSAGTGLDVVQADQCPEIDVPAQVDGTERRWGDWNCNGHLDTDDMMIVLKKLVGFIVAVANCPEVGSNVSVVASDGS